jgi:lysozyme
VNNFSYDNQGLALTEGFEGCRLEAYQDVRGVWTIGYGHTGADVYAGKVITQTEAEQLLSMDVHTAEACVNLRVKVPITQDEFDALVDFAFNVGREAFLQSTLLARLNAGDIAGAAEEFGRWVHAGQGISSGLVRRREAEAELFRRGATP